MYLLAVERSRKEFVECMRARVLTRVYLADTCSQMATVVVRSEREHATQAHVALPL